MMASTRLLTLPDVPVWVMEDTVPPSSPTPASAVAGRLGVPFRRIGAEGPAGRVRADSTPALILCSGLKAAARALLVKARHGGAVVHCRWSPARWTGRLLAGPFDLLVLPSSGIDSDTGRDAGRDAGRDSRWGVRPHTSPRLVSSMAPGQTPGIGPVIASGGRRDATGGRVLSTLGLPQPVSPGLLTRARVEWADRLSHLPWPRVTVLLGGGAPNLRAVVSLARQLTVLARARGGCIMASALPECPPAMADAFAAGLSEGMHLFHRSGEPGPDPGLAFLGGADSILVAWAGDRALSEACAADGPVFLVEQASGSGFAGQLLAGDLLRRWTPSGTADLFAVWSRLPLDESGRVARAILRRCSGLADRSLEPDVPGRA